jgi:hypothetical protein
MPKYGFILRGLFSISKLLAMSVLELKGQIYEIIAALQTKEALLKIREAVLQIKEEESHQEDWWDELSDEHRERLEKAIAHSRNPANRIPHEAVKKRHAKWLSTQ